MKENYRVRAEKDGSDFVEYGLVNFDIAVRFYEMMEHTILLAQNDMYEDDFFDYSGVNFLYLIDSADGTKILTRVF